MVSENGQNNNTIDSNTNTINSNTSEASFGNIQVFDSAIDQLNNKVGQVVTSDDDMIPEESLDENHIVE
ncbi:6719_t:CDS:2 [Funneliformis geosporum]|nr:6719_t:CDS:2 [Funneliformis geosporum]